MSQDITLINVFTVDPARAEELLEVLCQFSETTIRQFPGFISATFHVSLDGRQVTNVARWASPEAFQHMMQSPVAAADIAACRAIAERIDFNLYRVAASYRATGGDGTQEEAQYGSH